MIRQETAIQGLKIDHIIKQSKTAVDTTKKSNEILVEVARRKTRVSVCYRFVVYLSLTLISLFVLAFLFAN